MGKLVRIAAVVAVLAMAIVSVFLGGAYRASQQVPKFYKQALTAESAGQAQEGQQLEKQVFQLHNEARKTGQWQATFTDQQINGWLAVDMPHKFPRMLPRDVTAPRVAIDPLQAQIACRYEGEKMTTVLSLALEMHLTDEPNVIAVRIRKARAGMLPLPLKQWLDRITIAAQQANVPLRWAQRDGDPVALITVPTEHKEFLHREVHLETLEFREGEVFLAGRTEEVEAEAASSQSTPPTPVVHQAKSDSVGTMTLR